MDLKTVLCENQLSELVDKVTNKSSEGFDWMTTLKLRNMVKKGEVIPKYTLSVLKRKLFSKNPTTAFRALEILENLVDYSGPAFQEELTQLSNCKMLRKLVNKTKHKIVALKLLDLIRFWAETFGQESKHRYIRKAMEILKADGYAFPENKFNYIGYVPGFGGVGRYLEEQDQIDYGSANNEAEQSTAWRTWHACRACDIIIRPMERVHHCRDCRQVFCYRCAPAISRLDLGKEEVLCDNCYTEPAAAPNLVPVVPSAPLNQPRTDYNNPHKSEEELREEEELQLVLAISRAEAEEREKFLSATLMASTSQSSPQSSHQSSSQSTGQVSYRSAPSVPPKATVIQGLNNTRLTEEVKKELICSICISYFEKATTLTCSHTFCYKCIRSWGQQHNDCPICRSKITGLSPSRVVDNMVAAIGNHTRTAPAEDSGRSATSQKKKV